MCHRHRWVGTVVLTHPRSFVELLHGVEDGMVVLGLGIPHWHTPHSVLHSQWVAASSERWSQVTGWILKP
jgi:hypothetical protein